MNHASLFSGIGGFDLAAEWMGWQNIVQVEIDPFCLKILEKHFPNTERHTDIRTFPAADYAGRIDILTGGFPCQPYSVAGERKGEADERYLWPEMLRVISEIRPTWVIAENVAGFASMAQFKSFPPVDSEGVAIGETGDVYCRLGYGVAKKTVEDLKALGYEVQPFIIPAYGLDAPHRRDRIWIVAHAVGIRPQKRFSEKTRWEKTKRSPEANQFGRCGQTISDTNGLNGKRGHTQTAKRWKSKKRSIGLRSSTGGRFAEWPVEPNVGRVAHGIPKRVDRIKALGNAIVPQVAYEIFKAIN